MIKKFTLLALVFISVTTSSLYSNTIKKHESIIEKRNASIVKSIKDPFESKHLISATLKKKIATQFYQIELIDYWNDTTSQWDSIFRNTYVYNANGNLRLTTLTDVKTGPGLQIEYYYDANNKVDEAVIRLYDTTSMTWYDWVRDVYTYDQMGRLIQRLYQEWDTVSTIWIARERESMTFNQRDLMSMYLLEQNDGTNWIGVDGIKLEYEFDLNNRMILNTAIYLDPMNQSWDTVDRMQMGYNSTGTLNLNVYQLYVNGVWENSVKEEIQLDANDVAIGDLFFAYDLVNSKWDSTERLIDMVWFDWNGRITSSDPSSYIIQKYITNEFVNDNKYVATRPDFNGSKIEERFVSDSLLTWKPDSRASTIFDDFGNQINFMYEMYIDTAYVLLAQNTSEITYNNGSIVEMIYRELDPATGTLDYTSRFRYSALLPLGLNVSKHESMNMYPNPLNSNEKINIEINTESSTTIEVYNLMGQKVSEVCRDEKLSKGIHTFNINIPSGVYIIHTNTNKKLYTNKIIIK